MQINLRKFSPPSIKFLRLLSERLLPSLVPFLVMFSFDTPLLAVSTILASLIHELGHLAPSLLLGGKALPRPCIRGFSLRAPRSGVGEVIILLSGPFLNILVFSLFYPFGGYLGIFGEINLYSALFNLLPVRGFDGFNLLRSLLFSLGKDEYEPWLDRLSLMLLAILSFLSLYAILRLDTGYWAYAVFISMLLIGIRKSLDYAFLEDF